jgi:hypothetical protein
MRLFPLSFVATVLMASQSTGLSSEPVLIPAEEGTFSGYRPGNQPEHPWMVVETRSPSIVHVIREAQSPFQSYAPSSTEEPAGILWEDAEDTSWGPILSYRFDDCGAEMGDLRWTFDYLVPLDGSPSQAMIFLSPDQGNADRAGPCLFLSRSSGRLYANNGPSLIDIGPATNGTWHRVEVTIRLAAQTYDVVVQRWNGRRITVARGHRFRSEAALPLKHFNLTDGGRDSLGDSGLFLDNISLVRISGTTPVPPR